MPKKANTRTTVQRQKAKAQKGFELVRPAGAEREEEEESLQAQAAMAGIAALPQKEAPVSAAATTTEIASNVPALPATSAVKRSAATRMAERRQGTARLQQKNAAALITPEHFLYVRKDLIFISILAVIMIIIIVAAYLVLGRGI